MCQSIGGLVLHHRRDWRAALFPDVERRIPLCDAVAAYPPDLGATTQHRLAPDIKEWLAFATEKLSEVAALARGLDEGESAIELKLAKSDNAVGSP